MRVQEFSPVCRVSRMPPPARLTSGEAGQRGPCASFVPRVPARMRYKEGWWSWQVSPPRAMGTVQGGWHGAVCDSHATISLGTTKL